MIIYYCKYEKKLLKKQHKKSCLDEKTALIY